MDPAIDDDALERGAPDEAGADLSGSDGSSDAPMDVEPVSPEESEDPVAVLAPTDESDESTLSIDSTVVEKIAAITCRSVDGVLQMKGNLISSIQEGFGGSDPRKGVTVELVGEDACVVNLSVIMEYGKAAPKIFRELHDKISERVVEMTGLRVRSVNVRITNVMTREEIEGGRRRERAERPERGEKPEVEARAEAKQGLDS